MGSLPIFVSVEGAERLKKVSEALKETGRGDLKKDMRRAIRDAGKPVVADLKAAVMRVDPTVTDPAGGAKRPRNKSTGLRRAVAKATGLSVTQSGIRIKVSSARLKKSHPPRLAKYLDASVGNFARWRHPVFGNRNIWVEQKGQAWFFVTIRKHRTKFRKAVFEVIKDTSERITGAHRR